MSLSYSDVHSVNIQELHIPPHFNKYLVTNKRITVLLFFKLISPLPP